MIVISILFILGMSALWRLGGSVNTRYRRLGCPLLLLIFSMVSGFPLWKAGLSAVALFGATSLPITLIGDKEKENLVWIPFLGQIIGATLIPLTLWPHWWIGLIAMLTVGLIYTGLIFLSVFTNYKFKWSWFELLFGAIYAIGTIVCLR